MLRCARVLLDFRDIVSCIAQCIVAVSIQPLHRNPSNPLTPRLSDPLKPLRPLNPLRHPSEVLRIPYSPQVHLRAPVSHEVKIYPLSGLWTLVQQQSVLIILLLSLDQSRITTLLSFMFFKPWRYKREWSSVLLSPFSRCNTDLYTRSPPWHPTLPTLGQSYPLSEPLHPHSATLLLRCFRSSASPRRMAPLLVLQLATLAKGWNGR